MQIRIRVSAFHFYADPDPAFHFNAVRILLLIKLMRICDHWPTDPPDLQFEPPRIDFEPRSSIIAQPFTLMRIRIHFQKQCRSMRIRIRCPGSICDASLIGSEHSSTVSSLSGLFEQRRATFLYFNVILGGVPASR
jgi:hypothetical protein